MPPAGVSSPVTSHRLLCLSKSMSPATWQHSWRLTGTLQDLLLGGRGRAAAPVRVLDELEARELEVADVRIPRRRSTPRRSAAARGRRRLRDDRAVRQLHVDDRLRRVVQVHPLVVWRSCCRPPGRRARPRSSCRSAASAAAPGRRSWRCCVVMPVAGLCRRTSPRREVWMIRPSGNWSKPIGSFRFGGALILSAGSSAARSRRSRCRPGLLWPAAQLIAPLRCVCRLGVEALGACCRGAV